MARVWMEGFEHGAPYARYQPGGMAYQWEKNTILETYSSTGEEYALSEGRPPNSSYCLGIYGASDSYVKILDSTYTEVYLRDYVKANQAGVGTDVLLALHSNTGTSLMDLVLPTTSTANKISLYVRIAGTRTLIGTYDLQNNVWTKIEFYLKISASVGAYEFKIDNVSQVSASSQNTGTTEIARVYLGSTTSTWNYHDDLALNDTTGDINNSWTGDGQIVGLKPKADGADTDWTAEGYAVAEASSDSTTLNITGHGLATNDVIYNVTRNTYSLVTKVNDNQLTTSSITGQVAGDTIVLFLNEDTITAGTGTTTSLAVLTGHNLEPFDVIVNTSRSNAIRRVLYVTGANVYNSDTNFIGTDDDGATITGQVATDTIKTFKVHFYTINSWKTCANARPNPQLSRIRSNTSNQKTMFDMEELVADKAIDASSQIRAVCLSLYAGDIGTGGSEILPVLKSGVTENEGDAIALPVVTRINNVVYDKSPFTTSQWTRAEIDGLLAGVKYV
ncbi:MAG: hypothetical protein ACM3O3_05245 [Syntrophothermus sp.]